MLTQKNVITSIFSLLISISVWGQCEFELSFSDNCDYDGDGIINSQDLDDDNDGILDTDESLCIAANTWYTTDNVISSVTWQGAECRQGFSCNGYPEIFADGGTANSVQTFAPIGVYTDDFFDTPIIITYLFNARASFDSFLVANDYGVVGDGIKDVEVKLYDYNDNLLGSETYVIGNTTAITYYQLSTYYTDVTKAEVYIYSTYPGGGTQQNSIQLSEFSFYKEDPACFDQDTDGDGIIDRFDLDTDGDGCPDSIEAVVSPTTDLMTPSTTNPHGQSYGIANPNNSQLDTSAADTNNDGLNDSVDANGDGQTDYTNYYSLFAKDPTINGCPDTDGDGIADIFDLDDDNDGILDAVESPSCFYTIEEATDINKVTSTLASLTTSELENTFDGDESTYAIGANNESVANETIYQIRMENPSELTGIDILEFYSIGRSDGSTKIKWQGSADGNTWFDLTGTLTAPYNAANTIVSYTFTQNAFPYRYYRMYGISGNTYINRIKEIYPILSDYNPSKYIKPNCAEDFDGDGVLNHLDLDSDGDGCPDVKEASVDPLTDITTPSATNNEGESYGIDDPTDSQLDINNDANGDGLNESVDPDQDGFTSYYSTYNEYALSSGINLCADTDGDGILDIDDIDDDNDGILDADESPNCFYTEAEYGEYGSGDRTSIITATTTLDINSNLNAYSPSEIVNGNTAASDGYRTLGNADITGLDIFQLKLTKPVIFETIDFKVSATTFFGGAAGSNTTVVKIQGSNDGMTWYDLSSNFDASGLTTGTIPIPNPTKYLYYRMLGVQGSVANNRYMNEVTGTTQFIPSLYPKGTCTDDLDGDGIPNHLDWDSDGDGCPDAIEGTEPTFDVSNLTSETEQSLSGDSDAEGLPLQMSGTPQGVGTSQDAATFDPLCNPPYCDDPTLQADNCDFDGDGINNIIDLDDDNDGILDIEECGASMTFTNFNQFVIDENLNGVDVNFTLDNTANSIGNGVYTNVDDGSEADLIEININTPNYVNATFTFSEPVQFFNTSFYDIDGNETIQIEAFNGASTYSFTADDYDYGVGVTDLGNMTFEKNPSASNTAGFQVDNSQRLNLHLTGKVTKVIIKMKETDASGRNFGIENPIFCTGRDTDEDGIPNRFDLDSDGDGCPDAKESEVNGTFVEGDMINNDGTSETTTPSSEAVAEGPYGENGLANAVENNDTVNASVIYTSTYTPRALDSGENNCACYKDASVGPADPTIVGISTLNRYKNENDTHWPENIKSANITLDSMDKGFVITRMTVAQINQLDAVEGMLVYDIDNDCLKMYDGTEWFCLQQGCIDN